MDDAIATFAAHARAFCAYLDTAAAVPLAPRLVALQGHLLTLYTAALALPATAGGDEEPDVEAVPVRIPDMAPVDLYWEVFDPYEESPPVAGSLQDDLGDIDRDLRRGLACFDRGDAASRDAAAWQWRFGFEIHWGSHCIDALRALHSAIPRSHAAT